MSSDSTQVQSDGAVDQSVNTESKDPQVKTRSVEELEAALKATADEAKRYRQKNAQLLSEKEAQEKAKLEAEGKFKELAEKEANRAKELEAKLLDKDAKYAFKNIETEFVSEASKVGCLNTKALIKLVDLGQVKWDENYNVDASKVKELIDAATKEHSYLFKQDAPTHRDLPPKGDKIVTKSIADMSTEELEAALRKK